MVEVLSKEEELFEKRKAKHERYQKNVLWWNDHLPDLTARYAGQFVAVYEEQVVAVSSDHEEVITAVKAKGYPLGYAVIEYVHPEYITHKVVSGLGEPNAELKAYLERYRSRSKDAGWFARRSDELREKYLHCWVAVYRQQMVGASVDLGALLSELRAKGLPTSDVAYEYIKDDDTPRYRVFTPIDFGVMRSQVENT